jgi:hypothetical protein
VKKNLQLNVKVSVLDLSQNCLGERKDGVAVNAATVNREMLTLCAMLIEALLNGWILDNPFDRVRKGELIMRGNQETAEQLCYSKTRLPVFSKRFTSAYATAVFDFSFLRPVTSSL